MDEPSGQPLERLEAKLTQMRSDLETATVVGDAAEGKALLAEIEEAVAQRAELDERLVELVSKARRLGVPVKRIMEALGVSRRDFFKRYPVS